MNFNWLLIHLLPSIGFILALVLLSHILRERRSPTSTLAWLMAIIFIPCLGVPLYLIFGGRKMISKAKAKPKLTQEKSKPFCDNQTAIIGGMNLALEYMGPQESISRWQDLSLMVQGPVTAHITDIRAH